MNANAEAIRAQGEVDHIAERAIANIVETTARDMVERSSVVFSGGGRAKFLAQMAEEGALAIKAGFAAYHGREATP